MKDKKDNPSNKIYINTRIVIASNYDEAIQKIENGDFYDQDDLSDKVLELREIINYFNENYLQ